MPRSCNGKVYSGPCPFQCPKTVILYLSVFKDIPERRKTCNIALKWWKIHHFPRTQWNSQVCWALSTIERCEQNQDFHMWKTGGVPLVGSAGRQLSLSQATPKALPKPEILAPAESKAKSSLRTAAEDDRRNARSFAWTSTKLSRFKIHWTPRTVSRRRDVFVFDEHDIYIYIWDVYFSNYRNTTGRAHDRRWFARGIIPKVLETGCVPSLRHLVIWLHHPEDLPTPDVYSLSKMDMR